MVGRSAAVAGVVTWAAAILTAGGIAPVAAHAQAIATASADSTATVAGLRSPTTAVVLGALVPGAGLAYAGQWGRGAGTYFGSVGALGVGTMAFLVDKCTFRIDTGCGDRGRVWPQRALGVAAIGTGAFLWVRGAIDAKRIVERDNAERRAGARGAFGILEPELAVPDARGAPWRVGVRAAW